MVTDAIRDLVRWQMEQGVPLPLPELRIAVMEQRGVIVELCGNVKFVQRDSWTDFGERWRGERERRGLPVSEEALGRAIYRAQAGEWSPTFCNAVAFRVMSELAVRGEVRVEDCAIQSA